MSQYVDTGTKGFTAGAAIAKYLRVKLSSEKLAVAGITDREIGVLEEETFADGDVASVRLRTAQGTVKMVASENLSLGDTVYTAASGKIGASAQTAYPIGEVLEDASGDGSIVEVLRFASDETAAE